MGNNSRAKLCSISTSGGATLLRAIKSRLETSASRAVLPNSLKTELIMTGTIEQWKGFFKLRDAGSAHPQAYELAHPLHEEFIKRGWIK